MVRILLEEYHNYNYDVILTPIQFLETTKARISHWLYQCIMDLLYCRDRKAEKREKLGDLLGKVVRMTEFMKVGMIE